MSDPSSSASASASAAASQPPNALSFPVREVLPEASTSAQITRETAPPAVHQQRLYVGNLSPSVDEFTLVQIFSKHGRISKLDFLFHKSGPLKGKPRGYAFVEYADRESAGKALIATHDKLVRGRKLSVTFANQAAHTDLPLQRTTFRRPVNEAGKVTTLSLLKSSGKKSSTSAKIAAMEAKLKQMNNGSDAIITAPAHPSLPAKPFGPLPSEDAPGAAPGSSMTSAERFAKFKAASPPPRR